MFVVFDYVREMAVKRSPVRIVNMDSLSICSSCFRGQWNSFFFFFFLVLTARATAITMWKILLHLECVKDFFFFVSLLLVMLLFSQ